MTFVKFPAFAALATIIALGACTNPNGSILASADDPNQRAKNGALIGAGAGAVIGALSKGDGNRDEGAVRGALIGAALGAGGGAILDKQERDLRASLGNNNVTINNTGDRLIVTLPQDILFATNSTTVSGALQNDLRTLANSINQFPDTTVNVIGHTDNVGNASFNFDLSQRRAQSVTSVLIGAGVSPSRIVSIGRGEDAPIASNLNAAGRAQNRRVEIVITPN